MDFVQEPSRELPFARTGQKEPNRLASPPQGPWWRRDPPLSLRSQDQRPAGALGEGTSHLESQKGLGINLDSREQTKRDSIEADFKGCATLTL